MGGAGAVWDIARREDVPGFRAYLKRSAAAFMHRGKPISQHKCNDVIFDQVRSVNLCLSSVKSCLSGVKFCLSNVAFLDVIFDQARGCRVLSCHLAHKCCAHQAHGVPGSYLAGLVGKRSMQCPSLRRTAFLCCAACLPE
jgi:hypothetical protein